MDRAANVTSIDALKDYREALCKFGEEIREALSSAEAEIRRLFDWHEEEMHFWQKEIIRRQDLVGQAKVALNRRKMERMFGRKPDTTEEEKALRKAQMRLRQAEENVEKLRRLRPTLQRAVTEYEGPARQLSGMVDGSLPHILAWLDRRLTALEGYLAMTAPSGAAAAPLGSARAGSGPAAEHPPGSDGVITNASGQSLSGATGETTT